MIAKLTMTESGEESDRAIPKTLRTLEGFYKSWISS
jgi:hypothetical protein